VDKNYIENTICKNFSPSKPAPTSAGRLLQPHANLKRSAAGSLLRKYLTTVQLKQSKPKSQSVFSTQEKFKRAEAHGTNVITLLESHTKNLMSLEEIKTTQRTLSKKTNHYSKNRHYIHLKRFYEQPSIQLSKKQKAKPSLYSQLTKQASTEKNTQANCRRTTSDQIRKAQRKNPGYYDSLQYSEDNIEETMSHEHDFHMEEDAPKTQESKGEKSTKPARQTITKKWEIDPSISQLSAAFVTNLQVEQEKLLEAGEDLEDVTK
jgi:hypothetical protein